MSRLAWKQLVCLQRALVCSSVVKKVSDVRQHFLPRHKELQRAFLTFTIVNEIHLYTHVVGAFLIVFYSFINKQNTTRCLSVWEHVRVGAQEVPRLAGCLCRWIRRISMIPLNSTLNSKLTQKQSSKATKWLTKWGAKLVGIDYKILDTKLSEFLVVLTIY